jgi:hypothetical protein
VSSGPQEINVADWLGKVALELIGQAGFGYSFGTLENRNDQFCAQIKEYMCARGFFWTHALDLTHFQPHCVLSCGATYIVSLSLQNIPSETFELYGTNCAVEEGEPSGQARILHKCQREKHLRDEKATATIR